MTRQEKALTRIASYAQKIRPYAAGYELATLAQQSAFCRMSHRLGNLMDRAWTYGASDQAIHAAYNAN